MYRVRRPTYNCHQIASKCTKSHIEFQNFFGGDIPLQTPVPDWESEKVATLVRILQKAQLPVEFGGLDVTDAVGFTG